MKSCSPFIGKLALVVGVLIVLGAVFVHSGIYNVGADTGHTKLIDQVLNLAMMRSVLAHAHDYSGAEPPKPA